MKKPIAQLVAEHNAAMQEVEARHVQVNAAVSKQLRKHLEIRNQLLGFELRLYDELNKLDLQLEKINEQYNND